MTAWPGTALLPSTTRVPLSERGPIFSNYPPGFDLRRWAGNRRNPVIRNGSVAPIRPSAAPGPPRDAGYG